MEGRTIVTSDDHKLGTVVGEKDDCVIIETGHVFKTLHALPRDFVHELDGELRATVPKDAVDQSPKIDEIEQFDCHVVRAHYGLEDQGVAQTEPAEFEVPLRR